MCANKVLQMFYRAFEKVIKLIFLSMNEVYVIVVLVFVINEVTWLHPIFNRFEHVHVSLIKFPQCMRDNGCFLGISEYWHGKLPLLGEHITGYN